MSDTPGGPDADERHQPAADESFPRAEFGAMVRRLPAYARLAWVLARDPRVSKARRLAVLGGAAYVISPIDLVPGIVPLLGQLDDLAVALAVIRIALDGLKPELRAERLASVGLSQVDLDADVRTTRVVAVWAGRSGLRAGQRLASAAVETGGRVGNRLRSLGQQLGGRLRREQEPDDGGWRADEPWRPWRAGQG